MADPTPDDSAPSTPRWVKVFGILAAVVVLLFVVLMFAGGGRHGPRRHLPSGDTGIRAPAKRGPR